MPSEPAGAMSPPELPLEDVNWKPGALAARWARLPTGLRSFLRRSVNPDNQTRIHLADLIARLHGQIVVSPYTYGRPRVRFHQTGARLTIGRYGSIADGVEILLGGNHRIEWATTYPFPAMPGLWPEAKSLDGRHTGRGDIHIGHDVWLGSQCLIMSGVTIGHGAVVAARAVVTKDVPPYTIVAGNPARPIRTRLPAEQVEALLATRWWLLPEQKVRRLIPLLMSDRIAEFCAAVRAG